MIVDGKALAAEIKEQLKLKEPKPILAAVLVGEDPASVSFVNIKKKFGEAIGVEVRVLEYEANIAQADVEAVVQKLGDDQNITGIVVQLPLPKHLDQEKILALVPAEKDVDALGPEPKVLDPVSGAIAEILSQNGIEVAKKKALVIGKGKLVGRPVAVWLAQQGAVVETADSQTDNLIDLLKVADIVVSGAGRPHFIKPAMIKEGVILIDAATSDLPAGEAGASGKLAGDADPACADKCAIFTPVPGGVGPITVAKLFENLFELATD